MTNKKIWTWQQRILLKIETAIYFKSMWQEQWIFSVDQQRRIENGDGFEIQLRQNTIHNREMYYLDLEIMEVYAWQEGENNPLGIGEADIFWP